MRGVLGWRDGRWDDAAETCRRAHELAEQVGRSEVAFSALYWLPPRFATAATRGSETALSRALDVCERAGLIAQSIESIACRAVTLALGDRDAAHEAAVEAERLAERLHYPVGRAFTTEARGATDPDPESGTAALAEARDAWSGSAARSTPHAASFAGNRLLESDEAAAAVALEAVASSFDELGGPLAERAHALVGR